MKAAVCTKYGSPGVLELKELDKPAPKRNEVLIKIHAAAVTVSDCMVRSGKVNLLLWIPLRMFVGFGRPRRSVLGLDLAGEIEATGEDVKRFKKGDRVFAFAGKRFGAYSEYVCLPEDGLHMPADALVALMPAALSYEEAAAVPSRGALALHYLKRGNIKSGQKVLIYGASGGIGTFALQLAKCFGAEVTGVCGAANKDLVESLGADKVLDYTKGDSLKRGELYDLVLDAVGKKKTSTLKSQCRKALARNGKYISVDDGHPKLALADLLFLKELIEAGKLKTVIDTTFPLERIVEAQAYVEKGHKGGNVVVTRPMSKGHERTTDPDRPVFYEIRIKGQLGRQWSDWFEGLTVSLEDDGDTLISGPVADQAALHGLLKKVRDLGMPLVSVNEKLQNPPMEGEKK